jgi:hypothetical protein
VRRAKMGPVIAGPTWTADQVSDSYLHMIRALPVRAEYPTFCRVAFTPCELLGARASHCGERLSADAQPSPRRGRQACIRPHPISDPRKVPVRVRRLAVGSRSVTSVGYRDDEAFGLELLGGR